MIGPQLKDVFESIRSNTTANNELTPAQPSATGNSLVSGNSTLSTIPNMDASPQPPVAPTDRSIQARVTRAVDSKFGNIKPSTRYVLDSIANDGQSGQNEVASAFQSALQGNPVSKQYAEEATKEISTAAIEFASKYQHLDDKEFQLQIEREFGELMSESDEMNSNVVNEMNLARVKSASAQDFESFKEASSLFGEDAANAIKAGEVPPEVMVTQILPRLDDQRFQQVKQMFSELMKSAPVFEDPEKAKLNQNQILVAAIGSLFSPRYATTILNLPYQWLDLEDKRRMQMAQSNFEQQTSIYNKQLDAFGDLASNAAKLDSADYSGQVSIFNNERDNQAAIAGKQLNFDSQEANRINALAKQFFDPKTSAFDKQQIRQYIYSKTGMDVSNGFTPVASYIEEGANARTEGTVARTEKTRADTYLTTLRSKAQEIKNFYLSDEIESKINLTNERANQIAVITDLLPEEFALDKLKVLADIDNMRTDNAIDLAKFNFDKLKESAGLTMDVATQLEDRASELEKNANDLEDIMSKLKVDDPQYDQLKSQAEALRERAGVARQESNKLREESQEISKKATAVSVPNLGGDRLPAFSSSDLGNRYKGKYKYSMNRGPGEMDCSSFTQCVYKDAGIKIPGTAQSQYAASQPVKDSDWKVGDLLFFKDNKPSSGRKGLSVHHTGVIVGIGPDGYPIMRHMSSAKDDVQDISLKQYLSATGGRMSFLGARRFAQAGAAQSGGEPGLASHAEMLEKSYGLPANPNAQLAQIRSMAESGKGWQIITQNPQKGDYIFIFDESGDARPVLIESIEANKVKVRAGKKSFDITSKKLGSMQITVARKLK